MISVTISSPEFLFNFYGASPFLLKDKRTKKKLQLYLRTYDLPNLENFATFAILVETV